MKQSFLAPAALGFDGDEDRGWIKEVRGRPFRFRILRTLDELAPAEELQETAYGISERDLVAANELVVVRETGGAVIGAFAGEDQHHALGVLIGWGGFVGHPRIVSDFMAVRPEVRNLGLAYELKRLQAAIALQHGFQEIVWTVDPLLAANARLNFGKLGAIAREYEIDRYGSDFASSRYGGMPSDRLHLTWQITSPRVQERLMSDPQNAAHALELPSYVAGIDADMAAMALPADIDALMSANPESARNWRLRVREQLPRAFGEGFAIVDFRPGTSGSDPALVLQRLPNF